MRVSLLLAALCWPGPASAQEVSVYKYVDAQGVLHLTSKPPARGEQVLYQRSYRRGLHLGNKPPPEPERPFYWNGYLTFWLPVLPSRATPAKKTAYIDLVDATARQHGLDPALLHAVIQAESAYDTFAVSPKGAQGLMQLMPGTASRYGVDDPTEPAGNLQGGAQYLSDLLKLFGQDVRLALAAYHAGEGAVLRYQRQIPPYPDTVAYVEKVLDLYRQYRQ